MKFFTVEQLGPHQSVTPEGFLLIENTPIARTGEQAHAPHEVPKIQPGPDGIVWVTRPPNEVFRPETVASAAGKPIVNDHPYQDGLRVDVNPNNWREFACGILMNPRKGDEPDLLVGDIMITEARAIDAVRHGKRELSCGYDADFFETGPGRAEQRNIMINHVALVDEGRCGPRCAIGDHVNPSCRGAKTMAKVTDKKTILGRIRDAFKARDEKALDAALKEAEEGEGEPGEGEQHVHAHVHLGGADADKDKKDDPIPGISERLGKLEDAVKPLVADFASWKKARDEGGESEEEKKKKLEALKGADEKILGELEMEAPEGTGDSIRKARDSVLLVDSFRETVAMAEILTPGISIPVFDQALEPVKTFDAICGLRKKSLELAYGQPRTRGFIEAIWGTKTFDALKLTCDAARTLFRGAVGLARTANNTSGRGVGSAVADGGTGGGMGVKGAIRTPADLNKRAQELYGAKA